MKTITIGKREIVATIIAIIVGFQLIFFGLTGLLILLAFLILVVPVYLIINNFQLLPSEKVYFSVYSTIGIFPTFVYFIALAINNFALAIGITFLLLSGIGLGLRSFKKISR